MISLGNGGNHSTAESKKPSLEDDVYSGSAGGLRAQDLQEAKDQLLVEVADLLHVPLFSAEALLRSTDWSRETLLEKWVKDGPSLTCQVAGVQPPAWTQAPSFRSHRAAQPCFWDTITLYTSALWL